jgi:hypothetical protein
MLAGPSHRIESHAPGLLETGNSREYRHPALLTCQQFPLLVIPVALQKYQLLPAYVVMSLGICPSPALTQRQHG